MNEVLKKLCIDCEHRGALGGQFCPYRSLSNEYCDEVEIIDDWLKELEKYRQKYHDEKITKELENETTN